MANMSYCKFENTAGDMADCVAEMSDTDLNDLSSYELSAFHRLKDLCEAYLEAYNEVMDRVLAG